jgi:hypothetical protein
VPAFYSIRTYRRVSAVDEYTYPATAKSYGFNGGDHEQNTSYSSNRRLNTTADLDRRSSGSSHHSTHSLQPQSEPVHLQDLNRTPSYYSHQRDTQFDEYMAERQSLSLKDNIDRVMAAEFGWAGSPTSTTEDIARRDSVVNSGMVHSARAGPDSLGRTLSHERARQLTAVAEVIEDEEEGDIAGPDGETNSDRQALLAGHERDDSDRAIPTIVTEDVDDTDLGQNKRKWAA